MEHMIAEHRCGRPILVQPRLGQGALAGVLLNEAWATLRGGEAR